MPTSRRTKRLQTDAIRLIEQTHLSKPEAIRLLVSLLTLLEVKAFGDLESSIRALRIQQKVTLENLLPFFTYLIQTSDAAGQVHQDRTTQIAVRLAEVAGLSTEIIEYIRTASSIHDIGKIAIHDAVLFKHGRFTAGERAMMETHPTVGTDILRLLQNAGVVVPESVISIVGQHHENYDGTGYPHRIKNSKIHVGARALRIADFYEAITSQNRSYRSILSHHDAILLMKGERKVFDPKLFDVFLSLPPESLL